MRVRLVKPWQFRKVGIVLDLADGLANYLISRRFVAVADEEQVDGVSATPQQQRPRRTRVTA